MPRWTLLVGLLLAAALTLPEPARANRDPRSTEELNESSHPRPIDTGGRPAAGDRKVAYVIVTDQSFADAFQDLADHHSHRGLVAKVRTTQWIRAAYPSGRDLAESIRMFLQDAHTHWRTRFALMGGDEPFVPMRRAHVFLFSSPETPPMRDVPTDAYYACLEGDWNADGDLFWGEFPTFLDPVGDSPDQTPDLAVGRVPVQSEEEAHRFVSRARDGGKQDHGEEPLRALFTTSAFGFPGLLEQMSEEVRSSLDSLVRNRTTRLYSGHSGFPGAEPLDRSRLERELERGPDLALLNQGGDPGRLQLESLDAVWTNAEAARLHGRRARLVLSPANDCNRPGLNSIGRALVLNERGGADVVIAPSDLGYATVASRAFQSVLRSMLALGAPTIGEAWQAAYERSHENSTNGNPAIVPFILLGDPASPSLGTKRHQDHDAVVASLTSGPTTVFAKSAAILTFDLPASQGPQWLRAEVLDVSGRRVRDLGQDQAQSGMHAVAWDLRDDQGSRVSKGLYFVRVNAGTSQQVRRVLVN